MKTSLPCPYDDSLMIALHESGHILLGILYRTPILGVRITTHPAYDEAAGNAHIYHSRLTPVQRAVVFAGGWAALAVYGIRSNVGIDRDYEVVEAQKKNLPAGFCAWSTATNLLAQFKPELERLSVELDEKRLLTDDEIRAVIPNMFGEN